MKVLNIQEREKPTKKKGRAWNWNDEMAEEINDEVFRSTLFKNDGGSEKRLGETARKAMITIKQT